MLYFRIATRSTTIFFWGIVWAGSFFFLLPTCLFSKKFPSRRIAAERLSARLFRQYLERLGATYIKLGQIMSTRPDLLPESIIEELQLLQDRVPAFPSDQAEAILEEAIGAPLSTVFSKFDRTPVASASVAQVHRGVLLTGETVAIKIRRPHIIQQVALDEGLMHLFAKTIALIPTISLLAPVEMIDEFSRAIRHQLDFHREAENNRTFAANFQQDENIHFPVLYDEYCRENVLVMEFIEGVKESGLENIQVQRSALARLGVGAMLKMIFEHGFVHADLHPGNIIFQPGPKVTFVDLGLVARIEAPQREALAELFFHITQNNGPEVARIMFRMSPTQETRDYQAFEDDVSAFISDFYQKSLGEVEFGLLLSQIFRLIRRHRIRCQPDYTLINVAFLTMEGMGKKLDPTMDLFEQAQPFLTQHFFAMAQKRRFSTVEQPVVDAQSSL